MISTPADPVYWVEAFDPFYPGSEPGSLPTMLTFAFKESGVNAGGQSLRAMSQAEKDSVLDAIQKLTANIGLTLAQGDLASADIVFGISDATDEAAFGRTYYTDPVQVIAYDHPYPDHDVSSNSYIFKHELLHGLGLGHSTALFGSGHSVVIPAAEDDGTTLFGNWSVAYYNDLQLFDLAALQYLYGPNPSLRAGDDTYVMNPGAYNPGADPNANVPLLWDGGGYDTIDFSGFAVAVNASLVPGEISRINGAAGGILDAGTFAINYRTEIERLVGGSAGDTLSGNELDNRLDGGGGGDSVLGAEGADSISGGAGDDTLNGGTGNDTLGGDAGRDSLLGSGGADFLHGYGSHDSLYGGNGDDDLRGGFGRDLLGGSANNDVLRGFEGEDRLFGGAGNDTLLGNDDNDSLTGGGGTDRLKGDAGDDSLNGSFGADTVTGGAGDDVFEFRKTHGADVYDDFVAGAGTDDAIRLLAFGAAFDTFAEVIAAASDNGTHTTINFGGGDSILLLNVLVGDLHEDDFIFG